MLTTILQLLMGPNESPVSPFMRLKQGFLHVNVHLVFSIEHAKVSGGFSCIFTYCLKSPFKVLGNNTILTHYISKYLAHFPFCLY